MCSQEAKFSFDSLSFEKFFLAYLKPQMEVWKMAIEALGEGLLRSYEHPNLKVMGERTHTLWVFTHQPIYLSGGLKNR
jgi:hypothetical protein